MLKSCDQEFCVRNGRLKGVVKEAVSYILDN